MVNVNAYVKSIQKMLLSNFKYCAALLDILPRLKAGDFYSVQPEIELG
ncbi:MAG: hypothetical protein LBU79_01950 [Planctomycetota bacterium]|nr:hypothetical protein [Planctomycetota bacterium]